MDAAPATSRLSFVGHAIGPVIGLLLGLCLSALLVIALRMPRGQAVTVLPPATSGPTATSAPVRVYVSGAVARPGVYALAAGSIAQDALDAAGGPAADADLARVNLAQRLREGDALYVPRAGEAAPPASPAASGAATALAPGQPLDINTATVEQLDALPKIGPTTAQRIVEYREAHGGFKTIEEINEVSGIGDSTFAAIKDYICVCTPAP